MSDLSLTGAASCTCTAGRATLSADDRIRR